MPNLYVTLKNTTSGVVRKTLSSSSLNVFLASVSLFKNVYMALLFICFINCFVLILSVSIKGEYFIIFSLVFDSLIVYIVHTLTVFGRDKE